MWNGSPTGPGEIFEAGIHEIILKTLEVGIQCHLSLLCVILVLPCGNLKGVHGVPMIWVHKYAANFPHFLLEA